MTFTDADHERARRAGEQLMARMAAESPGPRPTGPSEPEPVAGYVVWGLILLTVGIIGFIYNGAAGLIFIVAVVCFYRAIRGHHRNRSRSGESVAVDGEL
jgi:hypothetical protein